jgi:hypothetical protein
VTIAESLDAPELARTKAAPAVPDLNVALINPFTVSPTVGFIVPVVADNTTTVPSGTGVDPDATNSRTCAVPPLGPTESGVIAKRNFAPAGAT